MRYYFDFKNIQYKYYQVHQIAEIDGDKIYDLAPYGSIPEVKPANLIDILEDVKMNAIGKPKNKKECPLSCSWYDNKKNRDKFSIIKKNINNFVRNIHKVKSDDVLWTCFKGKEDKKGKHLIYEAIKGDGYTSGFLACNARATNKYGDRTKVAYCVNRFMRTVIKNFFQENGATVDEGLYAQADMLQFLWRSAIRNDKPINIYIPSERMRNLLLKWLAS